ncbi:hypothetical protein CBM2586_A10297 [Cupriavidus phytorum]|uniref:Uncharacterized protein n=1 Tax=Cupriavidus taiwanensis TaxID=164546 RepID=A0A375B9G4_9BURK|nr:hypothetical protein CBM2586_A10297 [Cupriavidus taiwanensis]
MPRTLAAGTPLAVLERGRRSRAASSKKIGDAEKFLRRSFCLRSYIRLGDGDSRLDDILSPNQSKRPMGVLIWSPHYHAIYPIKGGGM